MIESRKEVISLPIRELITSFCLFLENSRSKEGYYLVPLAPDVENRDDKDQTPLISLADSANPEVAQL